MNLIKSLIDKAYWPIFGEMKLLDEINDEEICNNLALKGKRCPEQSGIVFSYIGLIIYMVIINVLLLNLLIAMFSATFQKVHDRTKQIWKFQQFFFVFEYHDYTFPPPCSMFSNLFLVTKYAIKRFLKKRSPESQANDSKPNSLEKTSLIHNSKCFQIFKIWKIMINYI